VLAGDLELADAVHLTCAAEQAVAVERQPPRRGRRDRARDVADEVGVRDVAGGAHRLAVRPEPEARPRRAAGLVEVAGHLDRALHAAADHGVLGRREVGDLGDRELGRGALDLEVAKVGVAEAAEGVVADAAQPVRQRVRARHREVPGEVQLAALDACALEPLEDVLHVRAAVLEAQRVGLDPVAVPAKRGTRLERRAVGAAQVAQGDDVALAFAEVLGRVDQQRRVGGRRRVGVQLGPDQLPAQRACVDHQDRRTRVEGTGHVGDRDRAGLGEGGGRVEPRHLGHDRAAGAEAVGPVVVGRLDRRARRVRRHHRGGQREMAMVPEVVVRPGQQAARGVDRVAAGSVGGGRRGHERDERGGKRG
jgi:hypothetical protein